MSKKPEQAKAKQAIEHHDLTPREFAVVGHLQKTIQDAQTAMQHMLAHVANSRLGYAEDVQLGFQVDFDKGAIKVEILRDTMESQTK